MHPRRLDGEKQKGTVTYLLIFRPARDRPESSLRVRRTTLFNAAATVRMFSSWNRTAVRTSEERGRESGVFLGEIAAIRGRSDGDAATACGAGGRVWDGAAHRVGSISQERRDAIELWETSGRGYSGGAKND